MLRDWQLGPRMKFEGNEDILDTVANAISGRDTIGHLLFSSFRSLIFGRFSMTRELSGFCLYFGE